MTLEQIQVLHDLVVTVAVGEGYERSRVTNVRYTSGEGDDVIVMVSGQNGDVMLRLKPDGLIFNVVRREVTFAEALQEIREGVLVGNTP